MRYAAFAKMFAHGNAGLTGTDDKHLNFFNGHLRSLI
jgi:hypothetical protein